MASAETRRLLLNATTDPPVTAETLKELDLQWMQNNINLRVDVHYDHDLRFMPISGRRGEEKRMEADDYWKALQVELLVYRHDHLGSCSACVQSSLDTASYSVQQRLPIMFNKLRALLLSLVPHNDHERVSDALDVDLLMQEVRNNALEAVQLSVWLSDLLTTHCAPIRDEWAHDMTSKISEGVQQNDMSSLVAGLGKLFSLCEAMKLDVANHQIRTFRQHLIENGVEFSRDFFQARIGLGKLDPSPSLSWYRSIHQDALGKGPMQSEYSVLVRGLILLATNAQAEVPELLKYDYSRICQLREEISDLVHLDLCCAYVRSKLRQQSNPSCMQSLRMRLLDLTDGECDHEAGSNALWDAQLDAVSAEVTRIIFTKGESSNPLIPATEFTTRFNDLSIRFEQIGSRLQNFAAELQQTVLKHVRIFQPLSALVISDVQQCHQEQRRNGTHGRHVPDPEDIARRMAHITVIHWRVWGDLYPSP